MQPKGGSCYIQLMVDTRDIYTGGSAKFPTQRGTYINVSYQISGIL
jgi:hypothetical protein